MTTTPEPPGAHRPAWLVAVAVALAAVIVVGVVVVLVVLTRRGPDARPELAQPGAAPAPVDPAARAAWAEALSGPTGVPARALTAYGTAERLVADSSPDCGLSWVTLAGLGRVESNHARFGGAVLGSDGRASDPVRGPQLDGTGGNRVISDTDGGRLDGDTAYDRAAGPMQFIPDTWALVGADADGDGRADPDDLDDAALAAGRYLCDGADGEVERDLRRGDDWRAAVLAYNRSGAYVNRVRAEAVDYARAASRP